jgi:hypothetical protein
MDDLKMIRGDTPEWDFTVVYPDDHPDAGDPVDITGATIRFMVKKSFDNLDADALINIQTPTDISITDAANGKGHMKIPQVQSAALENKKQKLECDLQVEQGMSKWTVHRGPFLVEPEVVRA